MTLTLASDPSAEVTDLLQLLIRNRCVNDGTPESRHESRSAALLEDYLHGPGVTLRRFASVPDRESLVVRLEGSDPKAPSLLLLAHTDVVPANPDGWTRDPFAAELADGIVWGRGAVDMLNLTASMAVALKRLVKSGFRPRGTLVYAAVADEEAAGVHGVEWLVEHEREAIETDYVITECGGARLPFGRGAPRLPIMVAEKGGAGLQIRVGGSPAHASMPFGSDNAVVKAAEIVHRLAMQRRPARIHDVWAAVRRRRRSLVADAEGPYERAADRSGVTDAGAWRRPVRACLHAHDRGADGPARRRQDQCHRGHGRGADRYPHAAR